MQFKIEGPELMPVLNISLERGEEIYSDKGDMCWRDPQLVMKTTSNGGFGSGLKRMFSGDNFFLNTYSAPNQEGSISFSPGMPGVIKHFELAPGEVLNAQKGALLAAEKSVQMGIHVQRAAAGIFGGEGFILQKFTGPGNVFIEVDGGLIERELEHGEKVLVDNGYLAYFEPTVTVNVTTVKGVKNVVFGGEGLTLLEVVGPGKIGLQTLPMRSLAQSLIPFLPRK